MFPVSLGQTDLNFLQGQTEVNRANRIFFIFKEMHSTNSAGQLVSQNCQKVHYILENCCFCPVIYVETLVMQFRFFLLEITSNLVKLRCSNHNFFVFSSLQLVHIYAVPTDHLHPWSAVWLDSKGETVSPVWITSDLKCFESLLYFEYSHVILAWNNGEMLSVCLVNMGHLLHIDEIKGSASWNRNILLSTSIHTRISPSSRLVNMHFWYTGDLWVKLDVVLLEQKKMKVEIAITYLK